MGVRGVFERQLVERPTLTAEGCIRKRWTATFFQKAGETESEARLNGAYAATEIALATATGCSEDGYVHLNPGLEPAQAFPALRRLNDVRLRGATARFDCSDKTGSRLCGGQAEIRQALARLSPWALTKKDGEMVFWLGDRGQLVTEVRYRLDRPGEVSVARTIPNPF